MATIHDVARAAGVSAATVSHVINQSRFVAPATRERVLQAIEALRYRRDGIARSLRRSRTGTIGLIISDIANPFFSDLVRGVEDAVYGRNQSYNLILCNTDEDDRRERLYIDVLLEKRIDGLIIAPAGGNKKELSDLASSGPPIVMVDRYLEEVDADSVVVNNRGAAFDAIMHLIKLGHRRIGVLRAGLAANSIDERLAGYQAALGVAGIPFDVDLIAHSRSDVECAFEVGMDLLKAGRGPTAVFCTNNFMMLGMVRALTESGFRCPEDVAVVGFDDFPWALAFRPRLTVVAQPSYAIGQEAVGVLFDRLLGTEPRAPIRKVLDARLIVRESCGSSAFLGSRAERLDGSEPELIATTR